MRWLFPGSEVRIDTICLDCGDRLMVRMRDDELLGAEPPGMVGFMTSPFARSRVGSHAFN